MILQAGLLSESPAWAQFLSQEGFPYCVVDPAKDDLEGTISLLIVNTPLTRSGRDAVEQYLRNGGGVLGSADDLQGVGGSTCRRERLAFLYSDGHGAFARTGIIDLGTMGAVPREANTLRTQDDTFGLFAGEMCGGAAVILPFDVESVLRDTRSADKSFYAGRERLPFERVSLVAKGEVRHLLHDALEFLCHARGFPYVHLWYYPAGHRNVFAFRIDSDGADRNDIDDLYALVRSNSIGASWYLDVKSHEPWLDHFGSMVGQEFGVHCYEHRVYDTYELNLENIRRARRAMEFAGLAPQGFAAPFGTWNHHVARAVDDAGFIYSSEFSLAYDTLPLYPIADSTTYSALQVPVHPISPGVLRRAGYSEQQMTDYFAAVIDHKRVRAEPLFFYHHPSHRSWKAMEALFRIVAEGGVEATTLGDFARWWMRRLRYRVEFKFDRSAVLPVVSGKGGGADDVWLHISRPDGQEAFSPPAPRLDLAELRWSAPAPAPPPADLRRIRDFDPRTLLAELYATMTRRLR